MLKEVEKKVNEAVCELINIAKLQKDDILIVGCSSSEVMGNKIGTNSSVEVARAIFSGLYPKLCEEGIYLAVQCCEHLNRAIVIEDKAARHYFLERVNVVPAYKAGGALAVVAYENFDEPTVVEEIRAKAGLDIGNTLIGMHLAKVAVPVRLSILKIGEANLVCARSRPKFIGGARASYDEDLM